ncbi:MAG TPA: steroid 3-ketoacyl-CoA thiolase [Candidatus Acidoferrales bacterium]|nr:steroid 3-ketoacyl-CoA thiolase [Candidatus Acidoferrales bacterium]
MQEVVIVEAVRSAIGRRKGGFAGLHPADLLGAVQRAAVERAGIDPKEVGQIVGGCVSQVGEQSFNIARVAWLSQGLTLEVAATTVDSQCGSSQQATSIAAGLIGAGIEDLVLACGVEMMTRVPLGANMKGGSPLPPSYATHYAYASQFQGAEMIAKEYGITREDTDRFGLRSQTLANQAWNEGRFVREVVPIEAPVLDENGSPTGEKRRVARDEGLRQTSMEKLAALNPVEPGGVHTAGTSSQVSDGAAAVLLASPQRAKALGLKPRARIATTTLVGVDPVSMLKGPIPATRKVLKQTGLSIHDIDVFEVNEAFASVVLAWMKEVDPNPERVNPNGGAIALGHPTGCTGARLISTALHELERTNRRYALIAMCCGGGLGTGTIIERL